MEVAKDKPAGSSVGMSTANGGSGNAGDQGLDNQFQTVTIVPSGSDAGEVSYVLIVEDPVNNEAKSKGKKGSRSKVVGLKNEPSIDEDVYDFDGEGDQEGSERAGPDDRGKARASGKRGRSQTVTQAHMCSYCNYTSPKMYLLSRHMKSHSEERPHKCSVCEMGFKTLASLQNHVNTHTGTKPHSCKFCDLSFTTSGELVRHVRYRHTFEKPHKCSECDYSSVELSKLKRHIRCHTGERPYQCSHCTYSSPDTFKLKRHMRIHTGEKPYICDVCMARFTQSNSLKAHRLIHTGDKPVFQCDLCPTTCGRKTDLRLHVQKLHTAAQPLMCKLCNKAFPDRYSLKVHKKSHEGERCFRCDLCPYSSISQRHLESHMLVHTDEKPFECDSCDQSFRQRQLLKRHQNLYHNPDYVPPKPKEKTHECPACARSFRHKGNLIRHMAMHDPDSNSKEEAMALKIGRRTRIQMINGHHVEVLNDEEEDEEEMEENILVDGDRDSNVMAVQGPDGQHYVVLEVIQLKDEKDNDQAESIITDAAATATHVESSSLVLEVGSGQGIPIGSTFRETRGARLEVEDEEPSKKDDMATCFGFDDDNE